MSSVNKVQAKMTTSTPAQSEVKPQDKAPNSIINGQTKEAKPAEPQSKKDKYGLTIVPKPPVRNITVQAGVDGNARSVGDLATQHRAYPEEIKKDNNLKPPYTLKEGQTLKIKSQTGPQWDAYRTYQQKYENAAAAADEKKCAAEKAKQVEENTIIAKNEIINAKAKGLDKKYSFRVNQDGHMVVTLTKNFKIGDIVEDFKLKDGVLYNANQDLFEDKIEREDIDGKDLPYNYSKAAKGMEFIIPAQEINKRPEKGFWSRLLD